MNRVFSNIQPSVMHIIFSRRKSVLISPMETGSHPHIQEINVIKFQWTDENKNSLDLFK